MRTATVVEELTPLRPNTRYLVVKTPDPIFGQGEIVIIEGEPHRIVNREMHPTTVPTYDFNGYMGLIVRKLESNASRQDS